MITEFLSDKMGQVYLLAGGLVLLWVLVFFILWSVSRRKKKKKYREAAEQVLLQITQTRHDDGQTSDMESLRLFEDLLHSTIPEKKPITFEIAIPNKESSILFFVSTPPEYVEMMKNQIRRVFERAQVQEVPDYTIFEREGSTILCDVAPKDFYGLPIRSYKKSNTDTFATILGVFANAKETHTGMALQIVLQKAGKSRVSEIKQVIRGLKDGKKLKHLRPTKTSDAVVGFAQSFSSKKEDSGDGQSNEAQLLEEKIGEQLYQANVRVGICTKTEAEGTVLFDTLKDRFAQFNAPGFNSFVFHKRDDKPMILNFVFRLPDEKNLSVLNADEITSIFRILNQSIEVSSVQWMKTKRVAAPAELMKEGLLLGDNIFHGKQTEVYIPEEDRMRHMYIIGQTGTGKSATIKSMLYQDIQSGKGACVIDPHGDLVDDMLATVPESRIDDVIVFDPGNLTYPLSINMLEYDRSRPEEMTFIVNEIMSIFKGLFSEESMGPMFEQYMRNSLLLLMEGSVEEPATFAQVPHVLTDKVFRDGLLAHCHSDHVKRFWEQEAGQAEGDLALQNIAPYITSKFNGFISNEYIRPIISQPRSSFSFREAMDQGKLLFVKLSKGKIGEINAGLLGMIVTGKITLAAFSRDDVPESERKDFYLYIDEFQNFTTDSINQILSEARKYRLSLTVAHQYMAQLRDDIRGAVLGNVGTTISFRVGIEDAEVLEKKFKPHFSAVELAETENLNCVISMLSQDTLLSPFTMKIRFAPKGSAAVREQIMRYSSVKYGNKGKRG